MLVIGNGESRKHIDVNSVTGPKIGCNAICRDYFVDHLICVDRRMVDEAHTNYNHNYDKIYTRNDWMSQRKHIKNLVEVPEVPYELQVRADEPFQWGSGPYAILLASTLSNNIHLIGFDLYGTGSTVNNVYKDTLHYDASDKNAVDPKYWKHQIGKVIESNPTKHFTIYQEQWKLPKQWNFANVSVDSLSNL
tara:strand:- start:171 stop:746 length:576 start_codon:yes stop_codon:yes gene_type:complete